MTTANDTLSLLATVDKKSVYSMRGTLSLNVNVQDAVAAKLLKWLANELGPEATSGQFYDVLSSALWWQTLFMSMNRDVQDEDVPGSGG